MTGGASPRSRAALLQLVVLIGALAASCDLAPSPDSESPTPTAIARLNAADFSASVVSGSAEETPSLIAARVDAVQTLRRDLPNAWASATRGLGKLTIVSEQPVIVITVLAATGTPFHQGAELEPGSITIYAATKDGIVKGGDLLGTAVHELGHIWCCRGPGTKEGHWIVPIDDGRQFGMNRYGLMNNPVRCQVSPDGDSICPNRFSDRELRTMGFSAIPAATPDPCIARADVLKVQLDSLEARLAQLGPTIDAIRAKRRSLPPSDPEWNTLLRQENALIDEYNRLIETRNPLHREYAMCTVE